MQSLRRANSFLPLYDRGEALRRSVIEENARNYALGITVKSMTEHWDSICEVIDLLPNGENLLEKYRILGLKENTCRY